MTHKNKVKELVGGGLNAYHTKSLQQMDRIEKKNKEQNHKISILSNELDNDYLTKTEEGSIISLEHSKEGMIYLDELQGNTLVNYCTDGSKELTLNGDIDVEGTFVTTTEGVDNGKVDVMCEGNTLVNLSDINTVTLTSGHERITNLSKIKPNTKYTQIIRVLENSLKEGNEINVVAVINETDRNTKYSLFPQINIMKNFVGIKKQVFTTPSTLDSIYTFGTQIRAYTINTSGNIKIQELLIEGEFDETLPYFEGMKSVGELEENKIEILSQNKNLYIENEHTYNVSIGSSSGMQWATGTGGTRRSLKIPCKPNTSYKIYKEGGDRLAIWTHYEDFNGNEKIELDTRIGENIYSFTTPSNAKVICIYISLNELTTKFMIVEGNILGEYIVGKSNKKEILLNEPLRGLPNGVKDKFVKIGGKWFIERNCRGKIITKDTTKFSLTQVTTTTNLGIGLVINKTLELADCFATSEDNFLLEGFVNGKSGQWYEKHWGAYSNNMNIVAVFPPTYTLDQMKDFIDGKQIVYQLKTPTYEPLEINPELIAYTDVTHISNNSLIPCNMKIKNSGYNAIIKPSTLYTVALDTNKSGTIGMNLGGVKGTTTNNVLTLTTPATLTDDSLRLYGKGIKGSKVRLLEGDKTNWTPSFFEGMRSSFEDKFDADDNTYKMEILSSNKNLIDMRDFVERHHIVDFSNGTITSTTFTNDYGWVRMRLKNTYKLKKGTYYLQFKMRSDSYRDGINSLRFENIIDTITLPYSSRLINPNCTSNYQTYELKFIVEKDFDINYLFIQGGTTTNKNFQIKDLMLSKTQSDLYVTRELNKIQFSSIEPLRRVDDTKDKFIFKNNILMIERNVGKVSIPSNFSVSVHRGSNEYYNSHSCGCYINTNIGNLIKTTGSNIEVICERFGYKYSIWGNSNYSEGICNIGGHSDGRIAMRIHNALTGIVSTDSAEECAKKITNYLKANPFEVYYKLAEPTYEEIPFELQKIILEGYENGTLFIDTNIPPTVTTTYAGETPIVSAIKSNKSNIVSNTQDINDNIIPYLMDMDYRVVCLQLENDIENISMARLFGGVYEMLKRDILSGRLSKEEYGYRLADYFNAGKLTEQQVKELEDLR